ncbi:NAD-capped RNA hydrolase NUDT12-like isoform X2 [Lineus longissimus]|uniref:NAD-capped RNA hydrolase NUDT12-like isoform X2 n=1 Tax=Lineus longissimus TaxID=88925 RepID=UPI00315CFF16
MISFIGRTIYTSRALCTEMSPDLDKDYRDASWWKKLHERVQDGNMSVVQSMISGLKPGQMNNADAEGWTPLMLAAQKGHHDLVKTFLDLGCDSLAVNKSGQTALSLALFGNHSDVINLLLHHKPKEEASSIFFCDSPLDRAAGRRVDPAWLEETMKRETSKFIIFRESSTLVKNEKDSRGRSRYELVTLSYEDVHMVLKVGTQCVFLGLEEGKDKSKPAWFALGVPSAVEEESFTMYVKDTEFLQLFPGLLQVQDGDAAICAQAYSILDWNNKNKFCPTCGSKTNSTEAGYKRKCENQECETLKAIHNTSYPRVDPSIIVLVLSPDGQKCLLGRQKRFPPGMWSCLAGFVEAGESIEDACLREMEEEGGIPISHVEYHSSQPWPYPSTLMIGCMAYSKTEVLKVDHEELEDARWFSKQEIALMFAHKHKDNLFVPPRQALAHQLLKSWMLKSRL